MSPAQDNATPPPGVTPRGPRRSTTPQLNRQDAELAAYVHIVTVHKAAGRQVNAGTVADGVRVMTDAELAEAVTLTSDELAARAGRHTRRTTP